MSISVHAGEPQRHHLAGNGMPLARREFLPDTVSGKVLMAVPANLFGVLAAQHVDQVGRAESLPGP